MGAAEGEQDGNTPVCFLLCDTCPPVFSSVTCALRWHECDMGGSTDVVREIGRSSFPVKFLPHEGGGWACVPFSPE